MSKTGRDGQFCGFHEIHEIHEKRPLFGHTCVYIFVLIMQNYKIKINIFTHYTQHYQHEQTQHAKEICQQPYSS